MQTKKNARARRHGYTLIELMAVVAIAGIVMTTAMPSLAGWVEAQRLSGAASELASDLQYARSEAVLRNQSVRVGFQHDASGAACYVLHTGQAEQCRCSASGPAQCAGDAQALKSVALATAAHRIELQSNVASTVFDPVHGTATPAATLRITGAESRTVQHTLNVMGRVRSCAPQAAVSGYRAC